MSYFPNQLGATATATAVKPGTACRREGQTVRYGRRSGQHLVCQGGKYVLASGSQPVKAAAEGTITRRRSYAGSTKPVEGETRTPTTNVTSVVIEGQKTAVGEGANKRVKIFADGKMQYMTLAAACAYGAKKYDAPASLIPGCIAFEPQVKGIMSTNAILWMDGYYRGKKSVGGATPPTYQPPGSGSEMAPQPGMQPQKRPYLLWGGVAVAAVGIGLLLTRKK